MAEPASDNCRCGHPRAVHELLKGRPGRGRCQWCGCRRFIGWGRIVAALGMVAGLLILACDQPGGGEIHVQGCITTHAHNDKTTTCIGETP